MLSACDKWTPPLAESDPRWNRRVNCQATYPEIAPSGGPARFIEPVRGLFSSPAVWRLDESCLSPCHVYSVSCPLLVGYRRHRITARTDSGVLNRTVRQCHLEILDALVGDLSVVDVQFF